MSTLENFRDDLSRLAKNMDNASSCLNKAKKNSNSYFLVDNVGYYASYFESMASWLDYFSDWIRDEVIPYVDEWIDYYSEE